MSSKVRKKPEGQVRQSQVVRTFGPGSLVDLPDFSVIVGGLDHWTRGEEIQEPRLAGKLKRLLGLTSLSLHVPPPDNRDPNSAQTTGIRAWLFPEWFITQDVLAIEGGRSTRSRRLVHLKALSKKKYYIDDEKKRRKVVPVRFVRACRRGHISDIDWYAFIHSGDKTCRQPLWMQERGTSGDLSEVWVRCECGKQRAIIEAARPENRALGHCDGSRPWLGPYTKETCGEPSRLLVRSASNAYFPQNMSVISLPDRDAAVAKAVDQVWENFLQFVDDLEDMERERRKKAPVKNALEGFSDVEVFEEILSRRGGAKLAEEKSVKQAELETLIASKEEIGNDQPDGDFYARALPGLNTSQSWMKLVERVVLIHRLREVVAQVGFTRFESSAPDVDGELEMGVSRAPLALETTWLPAVENRGEGVFVQFKSSAIREWLERPSVKGRGERLNAGFRCWKDDHNKSGREFPGLPYVMLHSLSHLMIAAVSLECGYPASSIRERIYAGDTGYGILLYTGSSDAEGTLGGLVETGRQIDRHLRAALELGGLCSNDPVCAQHHPEDAHECRFLHGAACHGCLLIAETSCEQFNDFLDRALVVPTVDNLAAEFFKSAEP